ncbi:transcriptional protein SWT1 isoform X1 [Lagopus muta]|uniref:transcriptional protein SWT1 isoform X1 n=2 Tax=Lagopus muta TaxID=64668 RepID=UPI0020A0B50C|nr:transcriptional protein SWT1 isoform X1 [Lagopus muta]
MKCSSPRAAGGLYVQIAASSSWVTDLFLQSPRNSEVTESYSQTVDRQTEFQRFKTEKGRQEKKQYRNSNTCADEQSQGESPNGSKTTANSLIKSEKRKRIVIQFKSKEAKHGKSTGTADVVTTSREDHNKGPFDGKERKRHCHSFVVQRDKVVKKNKVELCKPKVKVEQTVLGQLKSSVYNLYVPHKKADRSRKTSEDVRIQKIQKKPPSTVSTETACRDRPVSKKSNMLSRTCEEKYKEEYKEFSKKNQHADKHTSHCSTETLQQWDCCKWKKQDADRVSCNSGTEKGDFEATAFCFKQGFPSPQSSATFPLPQGCEYPEGDQEMQIVEDLHVARIEKRMAQSVVQTCGELTSMEIDLPEQDLNIYAETSSGLNILVVIDTNIMISHLEFVKSLKSEDIPGIGKLALIIPWVVLQELDNLKKGKMLVHVRQKAVPAVQFIYASLKNQDPKLWGQSMQLASQKIYGLCDENNDDRVLQCCLQYQSLFPQAVVILCTDDKNLCNKAIVCEVKALCKVDLVTALLNLNVNKHLNCLELQQSKCDREFQKTKESDAHLTFQKTERSDTHLTSQFPNIIPDLEKNLGEALSCILETEMKIVFGNLWMEILYLKPPWTLANLLQCYKKHWVAVFGYVVPRSLLATIEFLYKHFCTGKTLDTSTAVVLLQETKKLLHAFSLRSDYDGVLPRAYEKVNKLYQTCTEARSGSEQNSSEDSMILSKSSLCERMEETIPNLQNCGEKGLPASMHVAQEDRHQEIWSVLEGVWNTMNLYRLEIFQKLESNTVIAKSSFEEAFSGLQKLLAAVNYILEGIHRVLTPNSSFQDIWTLYNFLISFKINSSIVFSAEELYDCVSQELYRGRLEVGCCQLAELHHSIKQHHASAHMEAKTRGWL